MKGGGERERGSGGRGRGGLPPVGQQFRQAVDGVGGDAREHVLEVGEGLDAVAIATGDQAEEDGRGAAAASSQARQTYVRRTCWMTESLAGS